MLTLKKFKILPFDSSESGLMTGKAVLLGDYYTNAEQQLVICESMDDIASILAYLVRSLNLTSTPEKLESYGTTCATHLVKISRSGKGGYFRARPTKAADQQKFGAITEDDYSREESLYGSASEQKSAPFIIGKIIYNSVEAYLSDIVVQHSDDAFIHSLSQKSGWAQSEVVKLIATLKNIHPANVISNEAQIFVREGIDFKSLSVITPLSLPFGLIRAKQRLKERYEEVAKKEIENIDAQKITLEQHIKDLVKQQKASKSTDAYKPLVEAKYTLEQLKKTRPSPYLVIESFILPIGGSQPQNTGVRVNKSIHRSAIFNDIPNTPIHHSLNSYTFGSGIYLIKEPVLRNTSLPKGWGGSNSTDTTRRKSYLRELALEAIDNLCELRELWLLHQATPALRLTDTAVSNVEASVAPWALFIKGCTTKEERKSSITELTRAVHIAIKKALINSFSSAIHDSINPELEQLISEILHLEHS